MGNGEKTTKSEICAWRKKWREGKGETTQENIKGRGQQKNERGGSSVGEKCHSNIDGKRE